MHKNQQIKVANKTRDKHWSWHRQCGRHICKVFTSTRFVTCWPNFYCFHFHWTKRIHWNTNVNRHTPYMSKMWVAKHATNSHLLRMQQKLAATYDVNKCSVNTLHGSVQQKFTTRKYVHEAYEWQANPKHGRTTQQINPNWTELWQWLRNVT